MQPKQRNLLLAAVVILVLAAAALIVAERRRRGRDLYAMQAPAAVWADPTDTYTCAGTLAPNHCVLPVDAALAACGSDPACQGVLLPLVGGAWAAQWPAGLGPVVQAVGKPPVANAGSPQTIFAAKTGA